MAAVLAGVVGEVRLRREDRLSHTVEVLHEQLRVRAAAEAELAGQEMLFHGVFDRSPVGIGLTDDQGRYLAVNPALCRLFGRAEHEVVGRDSLAFIHPEDRAKHRLGDALVLSSPDGIARVEKRYVRPDGQVRWAWLTVTHVDGPDGRRTLAHVQDVTDRHADAQALVDSEANLGAVARVVRRIRTGEDARSAIVQAVAALAGAHTATIMEPHGDRLVVTAAAGQDLVGTSVPLNGTNATSRCWHSGRQLFVPDPASHPSCDPALVARTEAQALLWQPVVAHGRVIALLVGTWTEPITTVSDRKIRAIELLADETAVALEHDRLLASYQKLAGTDPLTELPNRRAWDERLATLMTASPEQSPLTVALLDLDHFKEWNDTHGHQAGDQALVHAAADLRAALRGEDLIARWGGEEFVLALPDCPAERTDQVLERVRSSLRSGLPTVSIGWAVWDGREAPHQLLARADAALYEAKRRGRDQVVAATTARRVHGRPAAPWESSGRLSLVCAPGIEPALRRPTG